MRAVTSFVVNWEEAGSVDDVCSSYDFVLSGIVGFLQISQAVSSYKATVNWNGNFIGSSEPFSQLGSQTGAFEEFFPSPPRISLSESVGQVLQEVKADSHLVVLITNDLAASWQQISFDLHVLMHQARTGNWLSGCRLALVTVDALAIHSLRAEQPPVLSIRCRPADFAAELRQIALKFGNCKIFTILNVPMKRKDDSARINYRVSFAYSEDSHFEAAAELEVLWEQKETIPSDALLACEHSIAAISQADAPTAVVVEALERGQKFLCVLKGAYDSPFVVEMREGRLILSCYRICRTPYPMSAPPEQAKIVERIIRADKKSAEVIASLLRKILSSEFLRELPLEGKMREELFSMFKALLVPEPKLRTVSMAVQRLFGYAQEGAVKPVFREGSSNILQLYATLFEVIESFMAEACVLSDGLSEFHQEFSKHLATFSTETMLRTLPFPTYLRSEVQQRAHATRRPAAPRQ